MVKKRIKKIMVGTFLTIISITQIVAQTNKQYPELTKFRKWSLVAGPVLYNKAKISPQYGNYTFDNKPMWGFNAGFEYDFYPERKWSFITGLLLANEPVCNVHYRIYHEDLYPEYPGDLVDQIKLYSMLSFSVPLLVRLNIQAGKYSFINFLSGFKIMYFPYGEAEFSHYLHNVDDTEARELFGLRLHSQDNSIYASFVVGVGYSYVLKHILLKANMIYVMNFQNTIEGEYQFGNLMVSDPTRGNYTLSGNYVGLLFSASLAKNKNKW